MTRLYRFGRFVLSPDQRRLSSDGQVVPLGARAIDLLHALIEQRERTVPKSELMDLVWPGMVVEEANLAVQVSALRKVLGEGVIATVPGRGYRFVAVLHGDIPAVGSVPAATTAESAAPLSPLIGRETELQAVLDALARGPLVTVTGPGGIGKTRLAQAVVHVVTQGAASPAPTTNLPDEAWAVQEVRWFEVASIRTSDQFIQGVAAVVQVRLGAQPDATALASALAERSLLLVLDNCEHQLPVTIELVRALRRTAARVHVLVTSQEVLRLSDESVVVLPPLSLPTPDQPPDERFAGLRLFAERVRAVDRQFTLDNGRGVVVADICRQLDGLPLAIELAAARVPLLGVHGLRDRLGERLQLLTRATRDAPAKHQTLRAALSWSYGLLTSGEQAVLRRLGVFAGGFTLNMAQQVARDDAGPLDDWCVLDALGALVDKSLVAVDRGEPVRYRLLETMRAFALERLADSAEEDVTRSRHAQAIATMFAQVDESRWGDSGRASADQVARLLQPEIDNARSALLWAMSREDWPVAVTLAGCAAFAYERLGLVRELLPVLRALRPHAAAAGAASRVNLLWRLGTLGIQDGMSHHELCAVKQEAVQVARTAGFRRRLQTALASLGFTLARQGDTGQTEAVAEELERLELPTDPVYVRALRLNVSLMLHEHRQDVEQAVHCLKLQRALLSTAADEALPLMTCESNLALYLSCLGRHEEAAALGCALLARPSVPTSFLPAYCVTAYALAVLGQADQAAEILRARRATLEATPIHVYSAESLAMLCLVQGRLSDSVRIDALARRGESPGRKVHPLTRQFRNFLEKGLAGAGVKPEDVRQWREEGALLDDAGAVHLALGEAPVSQRSIHPVPRS